MTSQRQQLDQLDHQTSRGPRGHRECEWGEEVSSFPLKLLPPWICPTLAAELAVRPSGSRSPGGVDVCWVVFTAEQQRQTTVKDPSSEASPRMQHNIVYTCCCWPLCFHHPHSSTPIVQWTRCRKWWRVTKHAEKQQDLTLWNAPLDLRHWKALSLPQARNTTAKLSEIQAETGPAPPPPHPPTTSTSTTSTPQESMACIYQGHLCLFHADNSH